MVNLFYHEIETSFFIRVEVGAGKVGWVRLEPGTRVGGWIAGGCGRQCNIFFAEMGGIAAGMGISYPSSYRVQADDYPAEGPLGVCRTFGGAFSF